MSLGAVRRSTTMQPPVRSRVPMMSVGLVVRTLFAVAVAVSGSLLAIRGWGTVVMAPDVQRSASLSIVALGVLFVALAMLLLDRPAWLAGARLALLVGLPLLTWGNAGRAYGLVAAAGLLVVHAGLVDRWPPRGASPGAVTAATIASGLVVVAQLVWIGGWLGVSLLGIALGAIVLIGHQRRPALLGRLEAPLGPPVRRFRGTNRSVVRSTRTIARSISARLQAFWPAVLVSTAITLLLAPVFWRYATSSPSEVGSTGFTTHLEHASRVEFVPLRITAQHPAFHVSVRALSLLVGQAWAATLLLGAATVLTVAVLVWVCTVPFGERPPLGARLGALFAAGYFAVESPAMIAAAIHWGNPASWAPMNHMRLSPTDTLLVPFGLVQLLLGAAVIGWPRSRVPAGGWIAAATVIATLVKPSVTVPLVMALPVCAVAFRVGESWRWRRIAWFVLPSLAVLAWQAWFVQVGGGGNAKAGIAVRPFETFRMVGLDRADLLLVSPVLVVVLCLWAAPRRYLREPAVALGLSCLVVALGMFFLLNETGSRSSDGMFAKPAFACWVMVNIVSWRFLVGEAVVQLRQRRVPVWLVCATVLLAVSLVAGVISYLGDVGVMQLPIRTSRG